MLVTEERKVLLPVRVFVALPVALPVETVVRRPLGASVRCHDSVGAALPVAIFPNDAISYPVQEAAIVHRCCRPIFVVEERKV